MSTRYGPFGEFRDTTIDKLTIEHLECQRKTAVEQLNAALEALAVQTQHNKELLDRLADASYQNYAVTKENSDLRKELDAANTTISALKEVKDS